MDHDLPRCRSGRHGSNDQPLGDWLRDALNPKLHCGRAASNFGTYVCLNKEVNYA
jgi:hypothetical protein